MKIIPAQPDHYQDIRQIVLASFPDEGEANLVENLRASSDAEISLIATHNDKIVGHVLFSKMTAPFKALGLGPVCVAENHRQQGIAAKLIKTGLARAKSDGWQGVFVLGEPQYYQQFGFTTNLTEDFDCAFSGPYFMGLALQNDSLPTRSGRIEYARPFSQL